MSSSLGYKMDPAALKRDNPWDALSSGCLFDDFGFSKLKEQYKSWIKDSFYGHTLEFELSKI